MAPRRVDPIPDSGEVVHLPDPGGALDRAGIALHRGATGAVHGALKLASLPGAALSRLRHLHGKPARGSHTHDGALVRHHARVLMRALAVPLVAGNRVELLIDGPATYEAMFAAIDAARDHINIESYIVEADGPGAELARRLLAKCREGVKVNLLYDGFGSIRTPDAYFEVLRAAGVRLCEYNPLRSWKRIFTRAVHLRDHRKLMVVDGSVAFVGGINISDVYSARSSGTEAEAMTPWRDTHVCIRGSLVAQFQSLFITHWNKHGCEPVQQADYFPPPAVAGHLRGAVASCDAGRRRNPFYRALIKAIEAARHDVLVTTAYFVPTRRLLRSLASAARRGVEVRLLLPGQSDSWAPLQAGRSHYVRLLQAGVRIYERQGALLHAKTTVIDGVWATVGSANLDWRSFIHNAEANAIVTDAGFGAQMRTVFQGDIAASNEITLEMWRRRGVLQRLQEWVARRFEFLL